MKRRNLRLVGYDYSQGGAYFVTAVVAARKCVLADVTAEGLLTLLPAGEEVEQEWVALESRFPGLGLDAFVIMPNHIHAVFVLDGTQPLGSVMRAFKSLSALAANRVLGRTSQQFWQRDYYDHIVRDEADLERIRTYIENNPFQWAIDDEENPVFAVK